MNILHNTLRVLLSLILITPVLGALGIFPAPTADMYNTPEAFAFIEVLADGKYTNFLIAIIFAASIALTILNRTALAALLILPITVNIICFHAFLDGGLLTKGAIMANMLALLNIYFLWKGRAQYRALLEKSTV